MIDQYDDTNDDYCDYDDRNIKGLLMYRLTSPMEYILSLIIPAFNEKCKHNQQLNNIETFKEFFGNKDSYVRDHYYEIYKTMCSIRDSNEFNVSQVSKLVTDTHLRKQNVVAHVLELRELELIGGNKAPKIDTSFNGISLNMHGVGVLLTMDIICEDVIRDLSSVDIRRPLLNLINSFEQVTERMDTHI